MTELPKPVLAQVRAILRRDTDADRIALVWPEPISAPELQHRIDDIALRVVYCPSELAMRELLVGPSSDAARLVLLTPFDERRLAKDLLARLWGQAPKRISPWRTLQDLLKLREIDPRLTTKAYRWISACLVDDYERYWDRLPFGEVLDFDLAWRALALARLGFGATQPDLDALFEWSLGDDVGAAVASLPEPMAAHLEDWLEPRVGRPSQAVLALWRHGHAADMLALGLVCGLLFTGHAQASRGELQALMQARVRFSERYLGGAVLKEAWLAAFGTAAVAYADRSLAERAEPGVPQSPRVARLEAALDVAEQVLASLGAGSLAVESDLLPAGYRQRLDGFADALQGATSGRGVAAVDHALVLLQRHRSARLRPQQADNARMAARACRWLGADQGGSGQADAAIRDYLAHGSWLDWARARLWRGDAHERLSLAYQALSAELSERREAFNRGFSACLPGIARGDGIADWAVPVEQALTRLVAPLAAERPVLLLVLDGMSLAVYRELAEDLLAQQWIPIRPADTDQEHCLLAAFPTITHVSRFALLSGELGEGDASAEKKAFAVHPALKVASSPKAAPRLLHKSDLQAPGGGGLSAEARAAVADGQPKIIGAVINAVDDQLGSNAQVGVPWSLASLGVLRQLLQAAEEGGRIVILTSDHGHVLDQDMTYTKTDGDAERFRPASDAPSAQELLLTGRRVVQPGQRVLLPWSERIRYAQAKMGYHGGGAPQEVLIPFGVFRSARDAEAMRTWREVPWRQPDWWAGPATGAQALGAQPPGIGDDAMRTTPKPAKPRPPAKAPPGQLDLGLADGADAVATDSATDAAWIDDLLASPLFSHARARNKRVRIEDAQLRRLIESLVQGGGQQMVEPLAKAMGMPGIRMNGFLASAQKLLNLDGYPVLSVDRAARTVRLDEASLRVQFEIAS